MKRPPVLKLEEAGTDSHGDKVYHLKLNGEVIRKDYNYIDEFKAYYSDENFDREPPINMDKIGAISCTDFPDRVELTVELNLVLFNSQTCSVDILRKGNKLTLVYDVCFEADANKAFIWSTYWFIVFLREYFTRPTYKIPPQPDPEDMEGEVVLTVERTINCSGTIGDALKADMKFILDSVSKTHERIMKEAKKFKGSYGSIKSSKRGKVKQISGNSADYPQILPSGRTNLNS